MWRQNSWRKTMEIRDFITNLSTVFLSPIPSLNLFPAPQNNSIKKTIIPIQYF